MQGAEPGKAAGGLPEQGGTWGAHGGTLYQEEQAGSSHWQPHQKHPRGSWQV